MDHLSRSPSNTGGSHCGAAGLDDITSTIVRVKGDSPYNMIGLQRAKRRTTIIGSAFLDVRVVKDFDPDIKLLPEKVVNVTASIRFLNDKPEGVIRDYLKAGTKVCNWIAKTGLGKTTKFPFILLKQSGASRILVIEPSLDIAKNVYRFLKGKSDNVALWSLNDFYGQSGGVIYCDGGTAASAIVNDPSSMEGFDYVVLDEAHETTGVYYALRVFLFSMKGTTDVIFMSATLDDCDDQAITSEHATAMTKLRPVSCSSFLTSVTEADFWHYRNITGRVMILVDTDDRCEDYCAWYKEHGVTAMKFGWDVGPVEYSRIFEQLTKDAGRNVVVISTCAARTGVTLPIDSVIDLRATIDYNYDFQRRLLTRFTRHLTIAEAKQGVGRVGRMSQGRAYVAPQEFIKFPFNIRGSHRIYACLWLTCMGYEPSSDVFPNEKAFLGKITRLGAAQLLNLYLHPVQARFYMNDDGLFYKNFDLAVRHYIVAGAKARFSDKVLDVANCEWKAHALSISCLNDGLTVTLNLPNDQAGINNAELLDCAVMELQWRNNRGPYDYETAKNPRRNRERYIPEDRVPISRPVEESQVVKRDIKKTPEVDAVAQNAAHAAPVMPYIPRRAASLPSMERLSKFVVLPDYNSDTYGSMASKFRGIRSYVMAQPVLPYDSTRDFLQCSNGDEALVRSLIDEDVTLSSLDAESRRRYHDSFCAVWNRSKAKERFTRDSANVSRRSIRSLFKKKDRDEDALDATIELESLFILDEQFRMYGMFVREATRYLSQHSDVVLSRDRLPIYNVCLAGMITGFGVVIRNYFVTLDHVCGNVPIVGRGIETEFSVSTAVNVGIVTVYTDCPVGFNTPYRTVVDGEALYISLIRSGALMHYGPYVCHRYDYVQFTFSGYQSVPGDSGAVITGADGMVVGLHVGVLGNGSCVGRSVADVLRNIGRH